MQNIIARLLLAMMALTTLFIVLQWDNFRLNGTGYRLFSDNPEQVWLYREKDKSVAVSQQVVDIAFDGEYIFVLRMKSESVECYDKQGNPTIITHYSGEEEYWVLYKNKNKEVGPLSVDQMNAWAKNHGLKAISLQIPKDYKENTKRFKEEIASCDHTK